MRTRTVTETEVFVLSLNDMRSPQIEILEAKAFSDDPEKLTSWLDEQRCEPWTDDGVFPNCTWRKVFRAGSPLEWFNDPELMFGGIEAYWVPSETVTTLQCDRRWVP